MKRTKATLYVGFVLIFLVFHFTGVLVESFPYIIAVPVNFPYWRCVVSGAAFKRHLQITTRHSVLLHYKISQTSFPLKSLSRSPLPFEAMVSSTCIAKTSS